MQVPRKIGLSAFQQLESKTPVPAKQQQSSGRTAEDPRKAKWRAAYLASQQEEDADEYEREEKAEKGAEAYLQGVLEQENCTGMCFFHDSVQTCQFAYVLL